MTAPAAAARQMLWALLIGGALGALYDFLRPLRSRRTAPADGLFLIGAVWGWLVLCFGICGADLRIVQIFALAAGGIVWEMTLGRLFRPVFYSFWQQIRNI